MDFKKIQINDKSTTLTNNFPIKKQLLINLIYNLKNFNVY